MLVINGAFSFYHASAMAKQLEAAATGDHDKDHLISLAK